MVVARTQVIVQFTDHLLARLDQHVVSVRRSRSEVIRTAVEQYLESLPEAEWDRQLVEAYKRIPQEEDPDDIEALNEMIDEEPW
jgi:metal-responsive CopG/Arc/MetJ family transcriptional regulator